MKSRIHLKLLMAPLSMLTLFACSPNQFQSVSEYDDVYFTSADRQKAPKVITKPESATGDLSQVITLENQSSKSVDQNLLNKYTNNAPSEVEYFVEGEVDPKVKRANQLNYDDFISDYENELLATYALPLDWETEWDANYFNNLVYNDFEFRLAWYEQYYVGNSDRMDRYLNANTGRIANSSFGDFNSSRMFVNGYNPGPFTPRLGLSIGFGFGNGFFGSFNDPFYDPFFDPFYDPFFYSSSWRFSRRNRFNRRNSWGIWNNGWGIWNNGFGFGGFGGFNSYVYCPPIFSNQYIYRGEVIAARNNRTYTRGGRVQSSSVASVRSDATNGVAPTRSQRLSSASGTRSAVSRSAIASRSERNSGRVRSTSSSGVTSSRSSRSSTSTIPNTRSTRSSRTSTDAYRFDESSRSSRSSNLRANATSGRSVVSSRTARSSSSSSRATTSRSRTTSRNSSAPTFNRSSSRSTSRSVSRPSSSSSSRGVSRSSSNRSTSSRSSGVRSSGSSSRSSSGSVSRGSSSSSRSSSSRSGSTSSRSSSSSSKSSSSSRSGRGN